MPPPRRLPDNVVRKLFKRKPKQFAKHHHTKDRRPGNVHPLVPRIPEARRYIREDDDPGPTAA